MSTQWTTDNLFNPERFEAWAHSLPSERKFNYKDIRDCVICNFIRETTSFDLMSVGAERATTQNLNSVNFPKWLYIVTFDMRMQGEPSTDLTKKSILAAYYKQFPETALLEDKPSETIAEMQQPKQEAL